MEKSGNFFICPNSLLDKNLSIHAKMVYIVLKRYASNKGECFPSIRKIGALASIKSPTTIDKAIKELIQQGFITKTQVKRTNGGFRSNNYKIVK